jgi:hypothetical protein
MRSSVETPLAAVLRRSGKRLLSEGATWQQGRELEGSWHGRFRFVVHRHHSWSNVLRSDPMNMAVIDSFLEIALVLRMVCKFRLVIKMPVIWVDSFPSPGDVSAAGIDVSSGVR